MALIVFFSTVRGRLCFRAPIWVRPERRVTQDVGPLRPPRSICQVLVCVVTPYVGPLRTVGGRTKGTPPPPVGNEPNRPGVDPHGPDASEQPSARAQIGAFLQPDDQSAITPVCGSDPCRLDGWDGSP